MSPLFIKLKIKRDEKFTVAIIVVGPLHGIELFAAILTTVLEWGLLAMLVASIIVFLVYLTVELIPNKLWPALKNWLDKYE